MLGEKICGRIALRSGPLEFREHVPRPPDAHSAPPGVNECDGAVAGPPSAASTKTFPQMFTNEFWIPALAGWVGKLPELFLYIAWLDIAWLALDQLPFRFVVHQLVPQSHQQLGVLVRILAGFLVKDCQAAVSATSVI